jgi:uroporphyrin-3 C-methyltransferase
MTDEQNRDLPREAAAAPEPAAAAPQPPEPSSTAEGEAAAPRGTPWYLQPALYLALAALGLGGWQQWQSRAESDALQTALASRIGGVERLAADARRDTERLDNAVRDLSGRLGALDSRVAETRSQQLALEAVYQELSRGRDEAALAEVEQLVGIASHQLALAGNVKSALAALQAADQRLARLDRPALAPARRALAADIARLEALPYVDLPGITARLDALGARAGTLPLAAEARPAPGAPAPQPAPSGVAWRDFLAAAWRDLRALVRIQRVDAPEPPLLAPEQAYFLREQLRLRLLSARLALLARDAAAYRRDLKTAEDWLARHFDAASPAVQAALVETRELESATVSVALPAIDESLTAVRGVRLTREAGG